MYQVATSPSLEFIYFIQMPFATSVSLVFITNTLSQRQLLNLLLTFFQYTCILFNLDMRVFHIFLSKECMNIIRVIISYVSDRYVDPTVFTFFRIPLCQRKTKLKRMYLLTNVAKICCKVLCLRKDTFCVLNNFGT